MPRRTIFRPAGLVALVAAMGCAAPAPLPMTHLVLGDLAGPRATVAFVAAGPGRSVDADVETVLQSQLKRQLGERAENITATLDEGRARLSGRVTSLAVRDAAVELARHVRGVTAITDDIHVDAPSRDDAELRAEIERRLRDAPSTDRLAIEVTVEDGRVALDGRVGSMQAVRLASRLTRRVSGVVAVDNRLVHEIGPRDDQEIRDDVETALAHDLYLGDDDTTVTVDDGRVVVTGTVASLAERYRAEELAWVSGARDVHVGGLEVDAAERLAPLRSAPTHLDDEQASRNVLRSLVYDPVVPHREIDVRVRDGVVTLTGVVARYAAKEAAEEAARQSRVARVVDNRIEVKPSRTFADAHLAKTARRALDADAAVEATDVQVEVVGGKATLLGTVDSIMERRSAIAAVSDVAGITEVVSELDVEQFYEPGIAMSDAAIASAVGAALTQDPWIHAAHVVVSVDDGDVTLTGVVADELSRRRAIENAHEAGARSVAAYLAVTDDLTTETSGS